MERPRDRRKDGNQKEMETSEQDEKLPKSAVRVSTGVKDPYTQKSSSFKARMATSRGLVFGLFSDWNLISVPREGEFTAEMHSLKDL